MPTRSFEGACHCGALEYTYETAVPPKRWSVRACQCGFCLGHGAHSTSDAKGQVSFRYLQPDRLRRYRFGLRTADFLICRQCGMYIGAVMLTGGGAVAVINVNTLKGSPRTLSEAKLVNHKNESLEERRGRRLKTWTPVFGPV
jgi:hypothetical protein